MALTEVVTLRISPRLYSTLEKQAEDKGVSMAEHIREVLDRRSGQDDVVFRLIIEITELILSLLGFQGYLDKEKETEFFRNKRHAHNVVRELVKSAVRGRVAK